MICRTPATITTSQPLRYGEIADLDVTDGVEMGAVEEACLSARALTLGSEEEVREAGPGDRGSLAGRSFGQAIAHQFARHVHPCKRSRWCSSKVYNRRDIPLALGPAVSARSGSPQGQGDSVLSPE
jgi:hypothetical protein